MAYLLYLSSFDSALHEVETTQDPKDRAEVDTVAKTVARLLAARFPEESKGSEDYALDWADKRIEGSIKAGKRLRRAAVGHGALPQFIATIDAIVTEAEKAHAVALARKSTSGPHVARQAGEWTRTQPALDLDSDDPISRALRDI